MRISDWSSDVCSSDLGGQKAGSDDEESFQIEDDLDFPGVNLRVKDLRLYGHDVGELSVVGVNQERGRLWRLDELKLSSPTAVLTGSGVWRLSGPDRGLQLDAHVDAQDLGADRKGTRMNSRHSCTS